MKKVKTHLIVILLVCFTSSISISKTSVDRSKSFNVSKGGTLFAKANPGNIIIDTWDKEEVKVELLGSNDADLDGVSFRQNGNQIFVTTEDLGWNESIDFYFKVPENFHLQLETTAGNIELSGDIIGRASLYSAGGNIQTANVQGELNIKTMGGNIFTSDISGRLSVNTRGGNISVGKIKGEPAHLNTMGGNISVESSESSLSVNTYGGEITFGNVGGSASAKTYGGNISMNKVEGNVTADTYGGSISVEAANGKVDVKTNGGNIDLKNIKGSVRAVTSAGNIYVELNPSRGGESLIKTSVGEIELVIPETAQATINAKIDTYTKWDRDGYDIVSDFPESTINEGERGIKKVFKLNSGKHEIRLKTTSSDIRIKKMK